MITILKKAWLSPKYGGLRKKTGIEKYSACPKVQEWLVDESPKLK